MCGTAKNDKASNEFLVMVQFEMAVNSGVIPKLRAFISGPRDLPTTAY